LIKHDLQIQTQVGVSGYRIDLAVIDPDRPSRYILGIECDGASYHSTATARERDRLRQDLLEKLGWRIYRIWSQSWFTDPENELRKILDLVKSLSASSHEMSPESAPSSTATDIEVDAFTSDDSFQPPAEPEHSASNSAPALESRVPSWVKEYVEATLPLTTTDLSEPNQTTYNLLKEVVKQEGPVHLEVAFRRITSACGVRRTGNKIQQNLENLVARAVAQGDIRRQGSFLWDPKQTQITVRGLYTNSEKREVSYIPTEEFETCVFNIIRDAMSLSKDDLLTETARNFGFKRITKDVRSALEVYLKTLLDTNDRIYVDDNERVQLRVNK
jgi:very-short-patch-repair endonuclease